MTLSDRMTLPNDITRCHDGWCASRMTCLRWALRYQTDADGQPVSHSDSLLECGADGFCVHLLTHVPEAA
jgi:hypothetical protein